VVDPKLYSGYMPLSRARSGGFDDAFRSKLVVTSSFQLFWLPSLSPPPLFVKNGKRGRLEQPQPFYRRQAEGLTKFLVQTMESGHIRPIWPDALSFIVDKPTKQYVYFLRLGVDG
jgi:hypothetical protein